MADVPEDVQRLRIPSEAERPIRVMVNTDSDGSRTPVPTEAEH
jgi:D-serine deaminase-like pyridoxal phosphate-dependent protein